MNRRLFPTVAAFALALSTTGCRKAERSGGSSPGDPEPRAEVRGEFVQVVAGKDNTCARTKNGQVSCWGDNAFTTTSYSANDVPPGRRTTPSRVRGVANAIDLALSSSAGCAVEKTGKLLCWRDDAASRLGTKTNDAPPLVAVATGVDDAERVGASRASYATYCVRRRDRSVSCLRSERDDRPVKPTSVAGLTDVDVVAPADDHTCVLRRGGKLVCWRGSELGDAPVMRVGVKALASGSAYSCIVDAEDEVSCWGSNGSGQSGIGGVSIDRPTHVEGLPKLARVAAGVYHTCGVGLDGHVYCWGENRFGELGATAKSAVPGVENAVDVAVGEWHSCALTRAGAIFCWGRNHRGQLGDGTTTDRRDAKQIRAGS
jgi:alpha-tubulin suppressor-like RCC1 family protein